MFKIDYGACVVESRLSRISDAGVVPYSWAAFGNQSMGASACNQVRFIYSSAWVGMILLLDLLEAKSEHRVKLEEGPSLFTVGDCSLRRNQPMQENIRS